MTLDEAIQEATNELGITDPHDAARHIIDSNSAAWLGKELREYAETFIADKIRLRYRRARFTVGTGTTNETWRDQHGPGIFVPEMGWKRLADLTESDCRLLASDFRKQAAAFAARAEFFDGLADKIAEAGVARAGDLRDDEVDAA